MWGVFRFGQKFLVRLLDDAPKGGKLIGKYADKKKANNALTSKAMKKSEVKKVPEGEEGEFGLRKKIRGEKRRKQVAAENKEIKEYVDDLDPEVRAHIRKYYTEPASVTAKKKKLEAKSPAERKKGRRNYTSWKSLKKPPEMDSGGSVKTYAKGGGVRAARF
jgi:hypothetical protein